MYSLMVIPPIYQWKILGVKPVHFWFHMDFKRVLITSYDYPSLLWIMQYFMCRHINKFCGWRKYQWVHLNFRWSTNGSGTKDNKWLSSNIWPVPTSGCHSYRWFIFLWWQPPLPSLGAYCCTLYPDISTNCHVTRNIQLYSQKQGF